AAPAAHTDAHPRARARRLPPPLPPSIDGGPPRGPRADDVNRREESLFGVIPRDIRKTYRMRKIVEAVVDLGSFFEIAPLYGRSVITGLARLDGWPVAIMASDPNHYARAWSADTCQKGERFVDPAQTFPLPVG